MPKGISAGPWEVFRDKKSIYITAPKHSCVTVAKIDEEWLTHDHHANADLIAAAPELLTALEKVVASFITGEHYETKNPYCRDYIVEAIAALKKARGGD